ncbi:MAG: ABC transporter permease [Alphaproteobacteria bacterium]|nr:ABC transporter permease [Alphaproteobacteria bacterium]
MKVGVFGCTKRTVKSAWYPGCAGRGRARCSTEAGLGLGCRAAPQPPSSSGAALKTLRQRLSSHPNVRIGGVLVASVALVALLGPFLAPWDPAVQDIATGLDASGAPVGPGAAHLLGTDALGRDVLSRLLVGARISLLVGFAATGISMGIGLVIGLVSGYFRGIIDTVAMRSVDVLMSFPFLLLCIALVAVREPGLDNVLLVLGLLGWTTMARVVRGKVLAEREQEYVQAARALGLGHGRILFRHILPNVVGPVMVLSTLGVASTILAESVLSYLGLGVPPPTPSWGAMISEGQAWYRLAPGLVAAPGLCILVTVLGFNLLGEGLRDVLDPRDAG